MLNGYTLHPTYLHTHANTHTPTHINRAPPGRNIARHPGNTGHTSCRGQRHCGCAWHERGGKGKREWGGGGGGEGSKEEGVRGKREGHSKTSERLRIPYARITKLPYLQARAVKPKCPFLYFLLLPSLLLPSPLSSFT